MLAFAITGSPACAAAGLPPWTGKRFGVLVMFAAKVARGGATEENDVPAPAADHLDRRDIEASLAGDGEAYGRLIRRHQDAVGTYLWRFTRDRRQWEELVHDVFVEAYLSLRSYRGRGPWLHWLRRIATRAGYRYWKERTRQKAREPLSLESWDAVATDGSRERAAADAAERVHAVLTRLGPRDRLVLTLMYLEECSVAEISELSGWSRSMVKVQAHRARKRLKTLLEEGEHA